MTIHKMKTGTFQETDYSAWKDVALQSMRGLPFDKLITKTTEGIDLQPLYIADGEKNRAITTIREAKPDLGWIVAQQQFSADGKQFVTELKTSIERGNEAIYYEGSTQLTWDDESLADVARLLVTYPIFITDTEENDPFLAVFDLVSVDDQEKVQGAVSLNSGRLPEGYTNVRTICADLRNAHLRGADVVTELAVSLAEAAEYAADNESFNAFSKQFCVRFAVDTHFFMEIAKVRAFRVLWQALGTAFGEEKVAHVPLLAETSLRTYSKLDPYVNLLRAGNEALSAVLGGADVLTVHPHNVLTGTTPASVRIARNVQLVIKEETLVNKVLDPAGGSYFIETLTTELVEKAWALFLEIEEVGGYKAYVDSGAFEARLTECLKVRTKNVSTGRQSLIGTNVYADLNTASEEVTSGIEVAGRLAEPFEKLRADFAVEQPTTYLMTFGELKDFKPRADFVSGFLATGGVNSEWTSAFTNAAEAIEWLNTEKPDYVVVCATNDVVQSVMNELLEGVPAGISVDVAGKYEQELTDQWLEAGLNGFVYSGQDKIAKLIDIKNKWKGDA